MTVAQTDQRPTVHVTSFAQEQLWVVEQLAADGSAYNTSWLAWLDGDLDASALRRAVVAAVNRHEALRAGFAAVGGKPVQVVHPVVAVPVAHDDVSGQQDPARAARELFQTDIGTPFDLATPPLLRVRLVRVGPRRHGLGLVAHHIVLDERSLELLLADVGAGYAALTTGRPAPTGPTTGYLAYAADQRRRLTGDKLAALEGYWRDTLAGAPALLDLPLPGPRPATRSSPAAVTGATVPAATADRLATLAQAGGATLFMAVYAALAAYLSRITGQRDLVVGTAASDRSGAAWQDVVGLFVNTVALRLDLTGRPTFRELLARARDTCLGAFAHQELPFERVVELVQPARSAAYHPVFQVMLTLHRDGGSQLHLPGVTVSRPAAAGTGQARFDLSLAATTGPDGLALRLQHRLDLLDPAAASDLLDGFTTVLDAAVREPDRPATELPTATGPRRRLLLEELARGDDARQLPGARSGPFDSLPERVRRIARECPESPAVTCGRTVVTYRELDAGADTLANQLAGAGVAAEVTVGLAVPRGPGFVTALHGIWRAGGVAVPLDPGQPAARLRAVVRQGRCRLVLTDRAHRPALAAALAELPSDLRPDVRTVDDPAVTASSATPQPPPYRPANLAYIIFTSGTTGTPKGAMVTHQGMLQHALAKLADLDFGPGDRLAQNGPATFDVVVWQCAAPLLVGGGIHVVPDDALADPEKLASELDDGRVTVWQAVPSAIDLLVTAGTAGRLRHLRWVVPTGDALPTELVARWFAARPEVPMLNTYGLTECSDDQCHAVIPAAPGAEWTGIAPIGRPIPRLRAYVLDPALEPVPVGVTGELYLGGLGVGRGYVGEPGRTADRFVPDPFGEPNARLYRTGDLARWRRDRNLEFLGRTDHQVKIRGFRVEPGEVEAALVRHPAVTRAVVVAREDAGAPRRLVAYVVPEPDAGPVPAAELRRFLAGTLPAYLVPEQVVTVAELPVTRHGKVDRAALPAPAGPAGEAPRWAAPEDSLPQVVAAIAGKVLGVDLGPDDDFFAHGGSSLLAVTLLARIRQVCGVTLTHADLLHDPTAAGITRSARRALREGRAGAPEAPIPPVAPERVTASFAQERLWVIDQIAASPGLHLVPLAFTVPTPARDPQIVAALQDLVSRHDALRTGLADREGVPVPVVAERAELSVTTMDLTALPRRDRAARARALLDRDARTGLDLTRPPLLRAQVLRMAADEVVVGMTVHHTMTDAWSSELLARDLAELVAARVEERPPRLPQVPVRYLDFAAWQRRELTGARLAELTRHWREKLAGAPEITALPGDFTRPPTQSYRGGRVERALPAELTGAVRRFSRDQDATPFMVLVAALTTLLHRWTGQTDLVVGTATAGREHPQLADVVGCFINMLPLRLDLAGGPSFRDVLDRARRTCLDAYAHADLPFPVLIEDLQPTRSGARHPVFQVALVMQNTPRPWGREPAPVRTFHLPHSGTAKFDLELHVVEAGDSWRLIAEYATDLFREETIRRLLAQLQETLQAAVAAPERPVALLPVLPARELAMIEANRTGRPGAAAGSAVAELVARQVRDTPDRPAVGAGGRWLSYQEFWAAAGKLAARLREAGVGPDMVVGIHLERGIDLFLAVHAVLAAGAGYVPLPPDEPAARLRLMLADSGARVVVTADGPVDWLAGTGVPAVAVAGPAAATGPDPTAATGPDPAGDRAEDRAKDRAGEPGYLPVPGDTLAYLVYTSGSTGRPKAVQITNRALGHHLAWMQRTYRLGADDRVLHKTPISFDMSVWELCWPLVTGAAGYAAPPGAHRDPGQLCDLLVREQITVVSFVPSMLGPFLDTVRERGTRFPQLRLLMCLGEPLPPRLVTRAHELLPGVAVENLYGPAEATIQVSRQPCRELAGPVVPIGRPVDDTWLELLDRSMQRLPVGAPGELYIGGMQLARGYGGRPDLTAARFVPDPYGSPGGRLYRTGDLGRWLPDGSIEFLGRTDHQVKIRGHRVEPGEVETILAGHPAVSDAAVVATGGRLLAYLVGAAAGPPAPAVAELRGYLAARLPDYLVPARFTWLAALPVTANGKLDRAALPDPGRGREPAGAGSRHVAPADSDQQALAEIWASMLRVGQVGAHDNFFELGGDSILGLRMLSRAAQAGLRITPRQFFDRPTVAGMSAVATRAGPRAPATAGTTVVDAQLRERVIAMLHAEDERMRQAEDER